MTTRINWIGHGPPDIERLWAALREYTLDPRFVPEGDGSPFRQNLAAEYGGGLGWVRYFGNFADFSLSFSLDTDEAMMCARLNAAIAENMARDSYKDAVAEDREVKRYWREKEEKRQEDIRRWRR